MTHVSPTGAAGLAVRHDVPAPLDRAPRPAHPVGADRRARAPIGAGSRVPRDHDRPVWAEPRAPDRTGLRVTIPGRGPCSGFEPDEDTRYPTGRPDDHGRARRAGRRSVHISRPKPAGLRGLTPRRPPQARRVPLGGIGRGRSPGGFGVGTCLPARGPVRFARAAVATRAVRMPPSRAGGPVDTSATAPCLAGARHRSRPFDGAGGLVIRGFGTGRCRVGTAGGSWVGPESRGGRTRRHGRGTVETDLDRRREG